jgi:hypothetical protein
MYIHPSFLSMTSPMPSALADTWEVSSGYE